MPKGSGRADPLLVEVIRGGVVESRHRGAVVVADVTGRIVHAQGDVARRVFPRSALKPVQALPLVETGAADAFGLGPEELALAAASHTGEAVHVDRVAAWLARIGLGADALECGAHPPVDADAAHALARAGALPSALHNNCSGKHAGFLTVARHLGVEPGGYIQPDHPVQRLVTAAIAEMTEADAASTPCGIDGCGIPVFALPLAGLATAMARLADPSALAPSRAAAARRIVAAMTAHPHLVGGNGRLDTRLMASVPRLATKGGAEGVHVAILSGRALGVAVKIADGAGRAAEVALLATLVRLGVLTEDQAFALGLRPELRNMAGRVVGEIRPAGG
ncbi:MAG: asparaginase [Actinomycetota bacterium]